MSGEENKLRASKEVTSALVLLIDGVEKKMYFFSREKEKLLVAVAAMIAKKRLKRGVKLNYPECVAIITDHIVEGARDGCSIEELLRGSTSILTREQVMDGIPEMLQELQVEATFPDGTQLVTVTNPIR